MAKLHVRSVAELVTLTSRIAAGPQDNGVDGDEGPLAIPAGAADNGPDGKSPPIVAVVDDEESARRPWSGRCAPRLRIEGFASARLSSRCWQCGAPTASSSTCRRRASPAATSSVSRSDWKAGIPLIMIMRTMVR